jgi:hypothetical protein
LANPAEQPSHADRIAVAMESIAASLSALVAHTEDNTTRLTKEQLAKTLGVSSRWIERNIRPSLRAARGGRSWYAEEHVREQLDSRHLGPTRRRTTPKKPNLKALAIEADLRKHKERTKP